MSIRENLTTLGYTLEDDGPDGQVWEREGVNVNTYVSLSVGDGIIQAVKMPRDVEEATTVIHFNRECEELTNLLKGWDVTPATYS